jgi:hypothetical protein
MADLNNLIEKLEALSGQGASDAIAVTTERLRELRDLVSQIETEGTGGLTTTQQQRVNTAKAIIKQAGDAAKSYGKSAASATMSTNDMTSALNTAAKVAIAGGLAGGLVKIGSELDKAAFKGSNFNEVFKHLGLGSAESTAAAIQAIYDKGVLPTLQATQEEFGALFGETERTVAGKATRLLDDLATSADETAAMADKLGRGLDVNTNSLRFFKGGLEGTKEVRKDFAESLKSLLPVLFIMGEEVNDLSLRQLATFKNALNLSSEDLAALGKRATGFGTSVPRELMKVERTAKALADATGLNRKQLGANLAAMRADFQTFGNVSTAELGKIAARAMSLGVELDKLTGLATKFDDFDTAADSVATLSQALGVNIDAFQLFETEDPTERLMMIREAFLEAGQDITQMNRRTRTLLANVGIDPSALLPALAPGGEAQERGAGIREAAAGLDIAALERSFEQVSLKTAEASEKYLQEVAVLTTRQLEGIGQQFTNALQNFALSRDNRKLITEAFTNVSKVSDLANDAFSGIEMQTGEVSKEAIGAIRNTQARFGNALSLLTKAVADKLNIAIKEGVNFVSPGAIVPKASAAEPPAQATIVSPAAQQRREVDTQQQAQAAPQEITLVAPMSLELNGVELGSSIAQVKLPNGITLGGNIDQLRALSPGLAPSTLNIP